MFPGLRLNKCQFPELWHFNGIYEVESEMRLIIFQPSIRFENDFLQGVKAHLFKFLGSKFRCLIFNGNFKYFEFLKANVQSTDVVELLAIIYV